MEKLSNPKKRFNISPVGKLERKMKIGLQREAKKKTLQLFMKIQL